jgi:hypothetical protein
MALECTLSAVSSLDQDDLDAVQALLDACTSTLFDPMLWLWAIGITIGCALVGLMIGLAKGRWLAGLVWGAALGPIGWAVVLLSKKGLVECPDCGHGNVPNAKACRQCGLNLKAAALRSQRSTMKRIDRGRGW